VRRLVQPLTLILLLGIILGMATFAVRQPTQGPQQDERGAGTQQEQRTQEGKESLWRPSTYEPITVLTVALVAFTAVLAVVAVIQIRFLARADETARIAANAAKRSADALITLERPWMVAVVDTISLSEGIAAVTDDAPFDFEVPIKFINEGRTTAFIEIFHVECAVSDYPRPAKGLKFEVKMDGKAVGPGRSEDFPLGIGLRITKEIANAMLDGYDVIWMFGYLEYTDFFREERRTTFCFDHNMGMGCVMAWGGKEENRMT